MAHVPELPTYATFGEMLHYLRRQARLTQRELAIAVGYSESMISRLEHNERPPDTATILALFVPALHLEDRSEIVARLTELAQRARGEKVAKSRHPLAGDESHGHVTRHHLPMRLTSFVGRAEDEEAVVQLLAQVRLVTLTGPGGCGKTSLAVETARRIAEGVARDSSGDVGAPLRFDTVQLVELLPLADPTLLAQTILTALGLEGNPEQPAQQTLVHFLANQRLLLLLDNCEHLVEQVASLAEGLLRNCPHLHILATSRERLNIGAETVYAVESLTFPDAHAPMDLAGIASYPAVQLFVERSQAVTPSFRLTSQSVPTVLRICELLDGIPLALELGAAATLAFSIEEIAKQLDARLLLASPGYRTADPRHQRLNDTVEWSYRLLAPAEQRMLVHLAVFVGGWTLEAMRRVVGAQVDVAVLLHQLVRKSLVRMEQVIQPEGNGTRYHLLRAIREFAAERLAAASEQADVRRRHFDYYAELAIELGDRVLGAHHLQAMAELDADYHNIRAAAQFSLEEPDLAEARLCMAAALPYYWQLRSPSLSTEGSGWLNAVHSSQAASSIGTRARAYTALLNLNGLELFWNLNVGSTPPETQVLIEAADAFVESSLAQGDKRRAAHLLLALAGAHRNSEGLAKCGEYARRAAGLLDESQDSRATGYASIVLTWLDVVEGKTQALRSRQEENFHTLQQSGSTWALCEAYRLQVTLADLAHNQADQVHYLKLQIALAERQEFTSHLHRGFYVLEHIDEWLARQWAEELLDRQRAQHDSALLGLALHQLGRMYVHDQQFARVALILDEAIEFWRRGGDRGRGSMLQWSLIDRGRAAHFLVDYAMAIRCYDESIAIFAASPFPSGGGFPQLYRGYTEMAHGDLRSAEHDFRLCLRTVTKDHAVWEKLTLRAIAAMAELAVLRNELPRAGELFGAAAMLDAAANAPNTVISQPSSRARFGEIFEFSRAMAAAAEYRCDPVFEAAWQKGSKLTLVEVISTVLLR